MNKIGISNVDQEFEEMSDINIIPLVDVMLVLLIIFMVTAPLSIGGIKVELPQSKASGLPVSEERIILSVSEGGKFFLDKMEISQKALAPKLKAVFEFRKNKEIYIRADQNVVYGKVVYAMSAAKLAGVQKLGMLTRTPLNKDPNKD